MNNTADVLYEAGITNLPFADALIQPPVVWWGPCSSSF